MNEKTFRMISINIYSYGIQCGRYGIMFKSRPDANTQKYAEKSKEIWHKLDDSIMEGQLHLSKMNINVYF